MSDWIFLEVMTRGGAVMWGILAVSVIGLALSLERIYDIRSARVLPPELLAALEKDPGNVPARNKESPLGRILLRLASLRGQGREALEAEAGVAGSIEVARLARGIEFLGTLASLAPLLGLLGTVTGLLRAFSAISANRTLDPGLVAGGVAEALLTTIFGLVVGIPLLVAHRLLRERVNLYAVSFEEAAVRAIRSLS